MTHGNREKRDGQYTFTGVRDNPNLIINFIPLLKHTSRLLYQFGQTH